MELNYIRDFVEIASAKNFFEAAENRFISQSSLSKHIKALEKEVGASLFDRTTRKVALSEYGKAFLPYAKTIVKAQDGYGKAIGEMLRVTYVSVGSIPTMAQYNITDMLYRFPKDNSDFKANMIEGDTVELVDKLLNGAIELAFIRETADVNPLFERLTCHEDRLKAVVPKSRNLAKETSIELAALETEDFVTFPKDTMLRELCRRKCEEAGFEMRVLFEGHSLDNIADFIVKGMGIALLMEGQTKFIRNPRTAVIDIVPEIKSYVNLCWKRDAELSSAAKHFLESVKFCLSGQSPALAATNR
jgi:DNA-binding transcriptional LysR family regulator